MVTDVRLSREFLLTLDMYPVAVDVTVEQGDFFSLQRRATIVCGVPPEVTDFVTVSMETLELPCATGTNVSAVVRPVDIEDFACENLSENGETSYRFEADPDVVLGEAVREDIFPDRADCRRTAVVTLNLE